MRCGKAQEWLSLAMDGQLSPERTFSLEQHLEQCPHCRQYRRELHLGQLLLRSTEPGLPESFEWRLQLRLNQVLQESARSNAVPWTDSSGGFSRWLAASGLAAAAGLAAMLTLSFLVLPSGDLATSPAAEGVAVVQPSRSGVRTVTDRLPLLPEPTMRRQGGIREQALPVSTGGTSSLLDARVQPGMDPPWSGPWFHDLETIIRLREDNQRLRTALIMAQRELLAMKEQRSDSVGTPAAVPAWPGH
jgi:hypothetical protein